MHGSEAGRGGWGGERCEHMCTEITVTGRAPAHREASMFEACHGGSYCDVMGVTCPPAAVPRVMIRAEKDAVSHRERCSVAITGSRCLSFPEARTCERRARDAVRGALEAHSERARGLSSVSLLNKWTRQVYRRNTCSSAKSEGGAQ